MFLWWLMAQHQLQLSFGGRRVRAGVRVCLVGGVCTYKYVLCRRSVRVCGSCVQSLKVHSMAFTRVGYVLCACTYVYIMCVCTHMSTLCSDVLLW